MLAAGAGGAQESSVPLYDNLGTHHYSITVSDPQAQRYFDQGLRLYYAFNHQEAIRAFTEAVRLDPACAMCHWGVALALGPNINAPMDPTAVERSEEHTSELQSRENLVCRLLLEKKKQ